MARVGWPLHDAFCRDFQARFALITRDLRGGMSRWRTPGPILCARQIPSETVIMTQPEREIIQPPNGRGRPFAKGNPGRRRGSKNRRSVVSAALLAGEEQILVRKAVELAQGGDTQMLKFLLNRILPRDRAVKVDLPKMEFADDAVEALGSIAQAMSEGKISPSEGAALATVVNSYARAIDLNDLVKRLDKLELELREALAA
jgi:hypothetical protein